MTDKFTPTSIKQLLNIILDQIEKNDNILGINKDLIYYPGENDLYRKDRFGRILETPIGVAAGPHTQMSQNIIASWLTGARYIELKTVQTLDELEVSKPCIDMQDEGYNCEWSQELKIQQSFDEYVNAWILIHILKDKLNIGKPEVPGFIFNMSVGYDLKGIMQQNVQWFLDKMNDASEEIIEKTNKIKDIYPNVINMDIPACLSDNITLSTMHGCPPDEIQQIADYLISERKLHTTVKLNPTLLGKEGLNSIIKNSGFSTNVPDEAFEHDLKYDDAVNIIKYLGEKAEENNVFFGLKLTNTLESLNNKDVFPGKEPMMYASGKVLHPVSVNVARRLSNEFDGSLDISFSGGADAFNINEILQTGLFPVTVSSDLLKPGGYGRLSQYIENISKDKLPSSIVLDRLNEYADKVLNDKQYKKAGFRDPSIKTGISLNYFDCAFAPCTETCPTHQDIPSYMYYTANGEFEKAYEVINETNSFPNSTGMICDHKCQTKCTRINYDSPLLIREIKRFVTEKHNTENLNPEVCAAEDFLNEKNIINIGDIKKTAIIGAGPSGLSCAYFLKRSGFDVEVYEAKDRAGGMVSAAVPKFRLTDEAVNTDINMIEESGVKINFNTKVDSELFSELRQKNDYIYIAAGAQDAYKLNIEGSDHENVLDPLDFLYKVKAGKTDEFGKNIVVIGGGNTAMDTVRTAFRLIGENGKVTLLYRRTIKQMPAEYKEIQDVIDEGIDILELASPQKVLIENNKIVALKCIKMKLGEKDESGRARPVEIPGSEFNIQCDMIIPAIGQSLAMDFVNKKDLKVKANSYETKLENVFIGGDALRNASTLINAVADGRLAAEEIIMKAVSDIGNNPMKTLLQDKAKQCRESQPVGDLMLKKSKRIEAVHTEETDLNNRKNFELVSSALTEEEAVKEASRCLLCDELCNICTTLCPNLALQSYKIDPVSYSLQKVKNGVVADDTEFSVKQEYQIIHIADWCNQCGNCNTFCPTSGAPYKEKPHLFLSKESFEKEQDGFWYDSEEGSLHAKETGFDFSLKSENDVWHYRTDNFVVKLDKDNFQIIEFTGASDEEYNIRKAAEMSVIIQAVNNF